MKRLAFLLAVAFWPGAAFAGNVTAASNCVVISCSDNVEKACLATNAKSRDRACTYTIKAKSGSGETEETGTVLVRKNDSHRFIVHRLKKGLWVYESMTMLCEGD